MQAQQQAQSGRSCDDCVGVIKRTCCFGSCRCRVQKGFTGLISISDTNGHHQTAETWPNILGEVECRSEGVVINKFALSL